MGEKTDLRKKRTRRLLRSALLELVDERGLERVTVSELTEKAEINRGTFYLHYRDVPDLMDQIKEEVFVGLTGVMSHLNPYDMIRYAEKDQIYPVSLNVLNYFAEHADFFRVILGPNGDARFPMRIREFMTERMYNQAFMKIVGERDPGFPKEYLIAFMTSANIGMLTHWIRSGMSLPVEELALLLTRIMYRGPLAVSRIIE
ncbi:TetR/AcrR family transcriptional regulator [Paenibacillus radicis (ex Gao et al. 2016)]|uniref:TetR family transcriptional regulator n=1 Tax=Paenibacillus radicis (ex Gao et al. 2016) TaxID=1737354 RepID=A0A917HDV2_9BACL|nr:TetR/AcrR family transcriptional regulator [Paenibacillus radicis (ex Gao et al. 2016)]GGG75826.1 TetR family transcriptional regulator [Paenibacillus radicis (ex Gao et al. 2016)]